MPHTHVREQSRDASMSTINAWKQLPITTLAFSVLLTKVLMIRAFESAKTHNQKYCHAINEDTSNVSQSSASPDINVFTIILQFPKSQYFFKFETLR